MFSVKNTLLGRGTIETSGGKWMDAHKTSTEADIFRPSMEQSSTSLSIVKFGRGQDL